MEMIINKSAPAFCLPDQTGVKHCLKDYLGKWVLVYFYPKDDTPGCTAEACALRDNFKEIKKQDLVVLGISADSQESHIKFSAKYKLPFTLLSDEQHKVIEQYNAWQVKKLFGKASSGIKRMSVLVDPAGKVAKLYRSVKPAEHAAQVLADLIKLKCS